MGSWEGCPFGVFTQNEDEVLSFVFRFGDESISVGFLAFFAGGGRDEKDNDGDWRILGVEGMTTQWFMCERIVRVVNALDMLTDWRVSVCVNEGEPLKLVFWMGDNARVDFYLPPQVKC